MGEGVGLTALHKAFSPRFCTTALNTLTSVSFQGEVAVRQGSLFGAQYSLLRYGKIPVHNAVALLFEEKPYDFAMCDHAWERYLVPSGHAWTPGSDGHYGPASLGSMLR
jgi:hypothetical protein